MFNLRIVSSLLLVIIVSGAPFTKEKTEEETGGKYIIKFKDDFDTNSSTIKISKHVGDFKLGAKVKWVYRKVFHGIAMEDVSRDALEWLQKQDYVEYVEESVQFSSDCTIPSTNAFTQSPYFTNWGLHRISAVEYSSGDINFNPSARGNGATIYILDSGVRTTHQEFDSNRASYFYSAFADPSDCTGHGTEAAGVAAGNTLGVANEAVIKSVKVLNCDGIGTADGIMAGLDYIKDNGALATESIISMSFSSSQNSPSLSETLATMASDGYILVAAAANGGTDVPQYPAGLDHVLSVGAINAKGKRACFSNFGYSVDIYAPGANIHTTTNAGDNKIRKVYGTSFAVPFVSGVAAMMVEEIKAGTLPAGTDIKAEIIATATTSVTIQNLPPGSNNRILYCD